MLVENALKPQKSVDRRNVPPKEPATYSRGQGHMGHVEIWCGFGKVQPGTRFLGTEGNARISAVLSADPTGMQGLWGRKC